MGMGNLVNRDGDNKIRSQIRWDNLMPKLQLRTKYLKKTLVFM